MRIIMPSRPAAVGETSSQVLAEGLGLQQPICLQRLLPATVAELRQAVRGRVLLVLHNQIQTDPSRCCFV
jgi:hypothetical protein